jgi:hypothetical protein
MLKKAVVARRGCSDTATGEKERYDAHKQRLS